jgi:serine protease Do
MKLKRTLIFAAILIGGLVANPSADAQSPQTLRGEPYSFRDVVKGVLPAVVSIDAKVSRNRLEAFRSGEGQESPDLRKFFEGLESKKPEAPRGQVTIGSGSGFIVDAKGIVMTNYHVVENADSVEITLTDGRKFKSTEIKSDKRTDLAIVRFDPNGQKLSALEFGDSTKMEVGDRVLAVGAPFGLSGSVTSGIISAKNRDVELNDYDDFLQTDAAINPGNSGGPLVNLDGKVIGVNSAIKSGNGGFMGVSLAISSNMARDVMVPLIRDGVVKRPYIGIRYNRTRARDLDGQQTSPGVTIISVVDKAPAEKGGLQPNDVIVSINNTPIHKDRDLTKAIASQAVGSAIEIGIVRNGKPSKVKVVLAEEPADLVSSKARPNRPSLGRGEVVNVHKAGLQLMNMTDDLAEGLGVNQSGGAIVHGVIRGSVADQAGMVPGSVILKVNNKAVESAEDAKTLIEESLAEDGATLEVQVNRRISKILLQTK